MTAEDLLADAARLRRTYGSKSLICEKCKQSIVMQAVGAPGLTWCQSCWDDLRGEREQQAANDRRAAEGKDPS